MPTYLSKDQGLTLRTDNNLWLNESLLGEHQANTVTETTIIIIIIHLIDIICTQFFSFANNHLLFSSFLFNLILFLKILYSEQNVRRPVIENCDRSGKNIQIVACHSHMH